MTKSIAERLKAIEYRLRHAERVANDKARLEYPDSQYNQYAAKTGYFRAEAYCAAQELRHIIEDLTGEKLLVDDAPVGGEVDTYA